MNHDTITPYNSKEQKKEQVQQMFNNIAGRYDFLNSFLSLGIHKGWRKKCVTILNQYHPQIILDVATGTADFAIECLKLNPKKIIGIDISEGMMKVGKEKIKALAKENLIELQLGDAETFEGQENYFDAIVVGFGVRNFQNLEKGLTNLHRMLKPKGVLVVLEFSYPTNFVVKNLYSFYFSYITPLVGKLFSKDKRAYSYLKESVKAFPHNKNFVEILNNLNYKNTSYQTLSLGIAAIYKGEK